MDSIFKVLDELQTYLSAAAGASRSEAGPSADFAPTPPKQRRLAESSSGGRTEHLASGVKEINDHVFEVYKPAESRPSVELVFFHGLQVERSEEAYLTTWLSRDESELWLNWIPKSLPYARILTISYDAQARKTNTSGRTDMYVTVENLIHCLTGGEALVGQNGCPVVLVGHCLGGLVMKELCLQARSMLVPNVSNTSTQRVRNFFDSIKGLFYYGTPNHGTVVADSLSKLIPMGPLFKLLFTLNKKAARRNEDFRMLRSTYKWEAFGIAEALETKLGTFEGMFVEEASSRHDVDGYYTDHQADHFTVCRAASMTECTFLRLCDFVNRLETKDEPQLSLKIQEDHENARISKAARPLLTFPQDPNYVVSKTTMIKVREALESETTPVVTLVGGPGEGKTSMARYLALHYYQKVVQNEDLASKDLASSRFRDGVVFLPCGPITDSKDLVFKLWEILGYHLSPSVGVMQGHASSSNEALLSIELTRRLSTQKVLIILDDVSEPMVIEKLMFPGQWLKYLITTQTPQLWRDARCVQIRLDQPTSEEACQILTNQVWRGRIPNITKPLQDAIDAIVEKADKHPLVLTNVATHIVASTQDNELPELEEWRNAIKHFEYLIQNEDASSSPVLFNSLYPPRNMKTSMRMALDSLSEDAQDLLLVASIFESQPVPVPEVVFKLFFKRLHGTLATFSKCSNHLQGNNFIQINSEDVPWSTVPDRTWSLHAMRQGFIGIIMESRVKAMADNLFLKCNTQEDILIPLLLLYGQDQWCDQAAKLTTGVSTCQIENDSSQSTILQLAPIKSFVRLLHADPSEEWEEKSHQLAKQILQKHIYCHELDDNKISIFLNMEETYLYTLKALQEFFAQNTGFGVVIPQTILAVVNLLEPANKRPANVPFQVFDLLQIVFRTLISNQVKIPSIPQAIERLVPLLAEDVSNNVQHSAAFALGQLAQDVENRIKIVQFPNVIGRLVALLAEDVSNNVQLLAAFALAQLAQDDENRIKIVQFPNVIGRLVALLAEDVTEGVQEMAAFAIGQLAEDVENRIKIVQFPNVIGRLVALLAEDVTEGVHASAAFALGQLAHDVENRIKIVQFSNVIGRLVALLAEDVKEGVQGSAAFALAQLAEDVENRIKIVQFPNVIGRLVALLVEDVTEGVQEMAAFAIGQLAEDVENRIKIVQFPNVIGRLVALLAEDVTEGVHPSAAFALGQLAHDVENRIKIVQFSNVIGRLVALLAEDVKEGVQGSAAFALAQLAEDVENRIKIVQFPNVIGRLVALLVEDVTEGVQEMAAFAIGQLAEDVENRIKIVQFPNVIGRLVALLAEDVTEGVHASAAFALGQLAHDVENRIKIVQFSNVIGRLVALLAEDVKEGVQGSAAFALGQLAQDVENRVKIVQFPNVIGRLVALLAEDVTDSVQGLAAFALAQLAEDVENRIKMVQVIGRLVALLANGVMSLVNCYCCCWQRM
ncbi:unnamed protein product [Calypogeia fissa]